MLLRAHCSSKTKTVFVGLGTAAVLVSGAAVPMAALAADPTPSADPSPGPSDPPSDSPPPTKPTPPPTTPPVRLPPSLSVHLSLSAASAAPGGSVTATIQVSALHAVAHNTVLRMSATSATVSSPGGLGDLGSTARTFSTVVTIPADHAKGTLTVTASLSADRADSKSETAKLKIAGSSSGGITLGGGAAPNLPFSTTPGGVPPTGSGQPQLPLIGQDPAVAPMVLTTREPVSLRANASPLGLDETSYRLVWTDVAWLTALMVGLSLLITQLRLNRHRQALAAGSPRKPRTKRGRPAQ